MGQSHCAQRWKLIGVVYGELCELGQSGRHAAAGALLVGGRLGQACMRLWIKVNPVFKQGEREGGRERAGGLAQCLCLGSGCTHHALLALT